MTQDSFKTLCGGEFGEEPWTHGFDTLGFCGTASGKKMISSKEDPLSDNRGYTSK